MSDRTIAPLTTLLADRYRIERELGSGGMATVYLAEDLKHGRQVAMKVFRPDVAEALGRDRFLREIETVARLNHPRILALYDSGEVGGFLFYVMPFVRGETLRHRLDGAAPLPIEAAVELARQAAAALQFAHDHGLVHRDVKPENILLHEGHAMVADFGIALSASSPDGRLTIPGVTLGTPAYMSPEQALADGAIDARSDQYSLGCVLYEMLAGEPPFVGASAQAVIAKHVTETVPSVRRVRSSVPLGVDRAIQRAMAKSPAERFPSIASFANELVRPASAGETRRSIAVLPFRNLSADSENEYFADGITEDVIAQLSKVRSLKVISRASVMRFKNRTTAPRDVGVELGVSAVLDGSVRRAGSRVRILAELIDTSRDEQVWIETYDRDLTDIFAIQSDVALRIATALRAGLSPEERLRIGRAPTDNMEAYECYLQGRTALTQYSDAKLRESLGHFRRAVEFDPRYAQALVGMALAYSELAAHGSMAPSEAYPQARAAASRALVLNPDLGEAYSIFAYTLTAEYDWEGAEEAYLRALELAPGHAETYDLFGRMRAAQCRFDESIALIRTAQELDPLVVRADLATTYLRAGRPVDAEAEIRKQVEADPQFARGWATLGWARFLQGHTAEGISLLERAAAAETDGGEAWRAQLGLAYGLTGRHEEARAILRRLEDRARTAYVSPYHFSYVHTGLGDQERALDCLEQAFVERSGAVATIKGSFLFNSLHSHPRFQSLLRRMNLS